MEVHILVVDDEPEIADLVGVYLRSEGFVVHTCGTAQEALDTLAHQSVDLAILDVMLPDKSGFDLCGELRREHRFPVLMLTAKSSDMDKITGLTIGADDYITKPFNPLELVARVKAQLRRYTRYNSSQEKAPGSEVIDFNGLFAAFHSLFFVDGTWTFNYDSLLISMYPIDFWMGMGAVWVGSAIGVGLLCFAAGCLFAWKAQVQHRELEEAAAADAARSKKRRKKGRR